jgi:hypothetical protein
MPTPIATASAYLEKLEADRRAAIAVSEQKAEEAKLITARKEGFQAAMEIFAGASSVSSCELQCDKSRRRRPRREIPELILRELSFSGKAMTTTQIAKAIGYISQRTEAALKRLEIEGRVILEENGRWTAVLRATGQPDRRVAGANGEFSSAAAAPA